MKNFEMPKTNDIKKYAVAAGAAIVLILIIIAAVSAVSSRHDGKYAVSAYEKAVTVNGESINAYKIAEGGPYIVLEELKKAGIAAEFSDEEIVFSYCEKEETEEADLDGKYAEQEDVRHVIIETASGRRGGETSLGETYSFGSVHLARLNDLKNCGVMEASDSGADVIAMRSSDELLPKVRVTDKTAQRRAALEKPSDDSDYFTDSITVFLDAGHGKSSSLMSDAEKAKYGWVQNESGDWGEWRHWRGGQFGGDCAGEDGTAQSGECWYPIEDGDRDEEPDINLQNCLSAKEHLERMGYKVVLSRDSSYENPSVTQRVKDAQSVGADLYVCVHSNAGGGSGSAYIALSEENGAYAQHSDSDYAKKSNALGRIINDKITEETTLEKSGSGRIDGEDSLILFCKSPIVCAYLEIGFYDNENDLSVLNGEYDKIGRAIAEGVDEYCASFMN